MQFQEFVAARHAQALEQQIAEGSGSIANLKKRLKNPNLSDSQRAGIERLIAQKDAPAPEKGRPISRSQRGQHVQDIRQRAAAGDPQAKHHREYLELMSKIHREQQQGILPPGHRPRPPQGQPEKRTGPSDWAGYQKSKIRERLGIKK